MRRWPSKWKGFVTTPTVRMPFSRAARATTGAAPVPVPPPMPAVTKHIWVLDRWSKISSMHSSAAARPTSGWEPAPRPSVTCAPSWISRSDFDIVSACASVFATTNSTPFRPAVIMLLTALPPPPPTPKTVMRGLSSVMSGFLRLIVIVLSFAFPAARRRGYRGLCPNFLETVPEPLTHPMERATRTGHARHETSLCLPALETRNLRVDEETNGGRKSRPFGCFRQAGHPEWTADPDVAPKDAPRRLR